MKREAAAGTGISRPSLTVAAAALALTACAAENRRDNASAPARSSAETTAAATPVPKRSQSEPSTSLATVSSQSAGSAGAPAASGPCERLSAAEAAKIAGLKLVGSAGSYRFYGRPRELLCSEPGAGGIGECEIVGNTVVRVENGGGSYGLRSRADKPAVLRYGPGGVSCMSQGSR